MVAIALPVPGSTPINTTLTALAATEGSTGHRYLKSPDLRTGRNATRNLADVIHHFTLLHGRHPGIIDHAALRTVHVDVRHWLIKASDGFAGERSRLTQLTVAVGPLPSTPGHAETESAVLAQRHALEMLAQSDRTGCAFGAAVALVLDWMAIRELLDIAAQRLSIEMRGSTLPDAEASAAALSALAETPAIERALCFGAQQLLNQHRGLWDLLEARHIARGEG